MQIQEGTEEHLLKLLDSRIKTERDELYFEQVKNFTNDFQFLNLPLLHIYHQSFL
mgnify:CR=1 FL=1